MPSRPSAIAEDAGGHFQSSPYLRAMFWADLGWATNDFVILVAIAISKQGSGSMATPSTAGGCIFCAIVEGEAKASIVYEDETILAFLDIRPVTRGHLLVIPKNHAPYLPDLGPGTGGHVFEVGMRLAQALRDSDLKPEGINFFVADGEAAMQEVFHMHLHVIPRYARDGFSVDAEAWRRPPPTRVELDQAAAAIRVGLGGAA